MKRFFSEHNVDYSTYTFSYAIYAMREGQESLTPIYEQGFLPYTGNTKLDKELFYLARSLRVNLADFADTSENRRVNRGIESLNIQVEVFEKSAFDLNQADFQNFCEAYIQERIGEENMNMERLAYILKSTIGTHILKFSNENGTLGYILAAINDDMLHYWFAFFDTKYLKSHSLGKWMMWRTIVWAKEAGLKHVYLGTAYKEAALYKIRDHKGLEYWNGATWSTDTKTLKELCKNDLNTKNSDLFKTLENPEAFLTEL